MELLCSSTGKDFVQIDHARAGSGDPEAARTVEALRRTLTDVMTADNFLVLTGAGTSRCVTDPKGKKLAPTMSDLWELAKNGTTDFDQILTQVRYVSPGTGDNIELLLSHCQLFTTLDPNATTVVDFIKATEKIIASKCKFVTPAISLAVHETFLRRIARRSIRKPRVKVFTTNYDMCFEMAASNSGFIVVDGFSYNPPHRFDPNNFDLDFVRRDYDHNAPDFAANVFHLLKLHGSVDWELADKYVVKNPGTQTPAIIYPRLSKFETSYHQPFLEMMSRFQAALRKPNTGLLVCGFGFNDAHLAEPILSAIRSNTGLKVLVVGPSLLNKSHPVTDPIGDLIKNGDWRLAMVRATFEEIVPEIPDLMAQTEEEAHSRRMAAKGGA